MQIGRWDKWGVYGVGGSRLELGSLDKSIKFHSFELDSGVQTNASKASSNDSGMWCMLDSESTLRGEVTALGMQAKGEM